MQCAECQNRWFLEFIFILIIIPNTVNRTRHQKDFLKKIPWFFSTWHCFIRRFFLLFRIQSIEHAIKKSFRKKFLDFSQHDIALSVGWMPRLANSMLCVSKSELFLDTNELEPGHNILLIFSLKRWLIKSCANGLTTELNMTMVCKMENMKRLNSMLVVCSTMWRIEPGSQVIPNMTLTLMTIRVTRFRTFNTPCEKKTENRNVHLFWWCQ